MKSLVWRSLAGVVTIHAVQMATAPHANAQNQDNRAVAIEIMRTWQSSRSLPTPAARAQRIQKAIALAHRARPWPLRKPSKNELMAQMFGQLGNEYRRFQGSKADKALDGALAAYGQALQFSKQNKGPDWARIQYGIARTLVERRRGNRGENVEQAITAFNAAQSVMTRAGAPAFWADTQINLSKAYWHRVKGRRTENLEKSIGLAQSALAVFTRGKSPRDWASAQAALGAAYWGRIKGSRADNIEKAIAAYEQAVSMTPRAKRPVVWAGLQDNIGMAYAERRRGVPHENLQRSATAFELAESVFTSAKYPTEWAQLNMNHANLLLDSEFGRSAERIEAAISRYKNALTVYSRQSYPERWARVMMNLGISLMQRRRGTRAENQEQAIGAFRAALQYYTPANDPRKWAITQNNLGNALRKRRRGKRSTNLENAASAHQAALSILTPTRFPHLHMKSALAAGHVQAERGRWKLASEFYNQAMATSEVLFGVGLNRAEVKGVIGEARSLFNSAAFAAIKRNKLTGAIAFLERGKARLLRVSLGLDALSLPVAERKKLNEARAMIHALEQKIELQGGRARLIVINQLEALRKSIAKILRANTSAAATAQDTALAAINVLMTRYQAIALPVITNAGAVLILMAKGDAGLHITAIKLDGITTQEVNRILHGQNQDGRVGGWLGAYAINYLPVDERHARQTQWLRAIENVQAQLSAVVAANLSEGLRSLRVKPGASILWLPHSGLGLLPISSARKAGDNAALIDQYAISTAPSLTVAAGAVRRVEQNQGEPKLTAVVNPTNDLPFTEPEGRVAASYFARKNRRIFGPTSARLGAVIPSLGTTSYWHFATHGTFSWEDPASSALQLADDERLTLRDIFGRGSIGHPRLVVLSACETGLFDIQRTPDEFIGLPAAFMEAGAAGVVGSLWPVDDTSTALVMMRFYHLHLGQNMRPESALRQAQLWLRDARHEDLLKFVTAIVKSGRIRRRDSDQIKAALDRMKQLVVPFRHPFHWAAFQFYGA